MFAARKTSAAQATSAALADAIDFDGTNDYLSRSSDLVGNADGKTFTFSAWVRPNVNQTNAIYSNNNTGTSVGIQFKNNGLGIDINATNAAGTTIFAAYAGTGGFAIDTFLHVLVSVDLTNTSNRSIYINDVLQSATWSTYTNDSIDFTRTTHLVGGWNPSGPSLYKGRISHLYLDHTYRDLSIEANRRLFITADRKPAANQAALNPILYLPLNDPTQPGKNLGTGGDFTLTGVVARSGRGPSQFNAPYSDLDGTSQYLRRTGALAGAADSKAFALSFCLSVDSFATQTLFSFFKDSTSSFPRLVMSFNGELNLSIWDNFDGGVRYNAQSVQLKPGRNYHIVISADVSDTNKRHFFVNGLSVSPYYGQYANFDLGVAAIASLTVGSARLGTGQFTDGRLGNVFFDTRYIDLSQPANLTKFVTGTGIDAKPADLGENGELPFGTPPLIYLPMYGNNAGKNCGTGGDFTVMSGPFPGARGPNEFWGNKADFDGSTGYLARTSALTGVSDGVVISGSMFITTDQTTARVFRGVDASNNVRGFVFLIVSGVLYFVGTNSAGAEGLRITCGTVAAGTSYSIQYCFNLANAANRYVFINGVQQTLTVTTYDASRTFNLSCQITQIGASPNLPAFFDGRLSEFYFTTSYIDFSQEANRLKFRDAFGNPVDLAPQIAAGTLPNPAIYMRFDPANFGKNSGTGGDFTVAGTITDGGNL